MKKLLVLPLFLFASIANADLVPYSVQFVKPAIARGFLTLVGPGKIDLNKKQIAYTQHVHIAIRNIDSLSDVSGVKEGCIINYSSSKYSERISVLEQSCSTVMDKINSAR